MPCKLISLILAHGCSSTTMMFTRLACKDTSINSILKCVTCQRTINASREATPAFLKSQCYYIGWCTTLLFSLHSICSTVPMAVTSDLPHDSPACHRSQGIDTKQYVCSSRQRHWPQSMPQTSNILLSSRCPSGHCLGRPIPATHLQCWSYNQGMSLVITLHGLY